MCSLAVVSVKICCCLNPYVFFFCRWKFWKHSGTTGWLQCFKMRRHAELLLSGLLHSLTRTNYLKGEVTSKDFQELECIVDRNNGALFGYTKDTLLQIAGSDPRYVGNTGQSDAFQLIGWYNVKILHLYQGRFFRGATLTESKTDLQEIIIVF